MRDERDEIRSRIDIVDLVGQKVLLKRAGKNWKGLCPFHDDRNPSFVVNPDYGSYRCWSCGEKGDAFTWVMKTQNVEFGEALRLLAAQAGVPLRARKGVPDESSRQRRLAAMQAAQTFFVESLAQTPAAQAYLERRGIDGQVASDWGLGYAPETDHMLATRLRREKFTLAEARELFLVEDDGTGGYFDKFRGRLMFPIHDERGDLIAFGGRILGDGHPKYINSSDTPLFRKNRVLYGMHRAKEKIGATRTAVLVEGYLDVIACHRAGLGQAVASLGTSLAEEHAKLLKRWAETVIVLYDADAAGEKAAHRACELLLAEGLAVRVALMAPGEDPDTLLRAQGPEAVRRAVDGAMTPTEFRIRRIEANLDSGDDEFWRQAVDALAEATSFPEIERCVAQLAGKHFGRSRASQESLMQRVRHAQRAKLRQSKTARPSTAAIETPPLAAAEALLLRAFLENDLRREVHQALRNGLAVSETGEGIARAILDAFPNDPPTGRPVEWLDQVEAEARGRLLDAAMDPREANPLLRRTRGDVTAGELADALIELKNELERRERMQWQAESLSSEALAAGFEALRAKHERLAYRHEE